MSIKDMKYVTVEQALSLRDAAIKIEQQRDQLAEALRWIASVNACDHEYQSKARAALQQLENES